MLRDSALLAVLLVATATSAQVPAPPPPSQEASDDTEVEVDLDMAIPAPPPPARRSSAVDRALRDHDYAAALAALATAPVDATEARALLRRALRPRRSWDPPETPGDRAALVRALLDAGADPTEPPMPMDRRRPSFLEDAVELGDADVVQALLGAGADPDVYRVGDGEGLFEDVFVASTPLDLARRRGDEAIVALLSDAGAQTAAVALAAALAERARADALGPSAEAALRAFPPHWRGFRLEEMVRRTRPFVEGRNPIDVGARYADADGQALAVRVGVVGPGRWAEAVERHTRRGSAEYEPVAAPAPDVTAYSATTRFDDRRLLVHEPTGTLVSVRAEGDEGARPTDLAAPLALDVLRALTSPTPPTRSCGVDSQGEIADVSATAAFHCALPAQSGRLALHVFRQADGREGAYLAAYADPYGRLPRVAVVAGPRGLFGDDLSVTRAEAARDGTRIGGRSALVFPPSATTEGLPIVVVPYDRSQLVLFPDGEVPADTLEALAGRIDLDGFDAQVEARPNLAPDLQCDRDLHPDAKRALGLAPETTAFWSSVRYVSEARAATVQRDGAVVTLPADAWAGAVEAGDVLWAPAGPDGDRTFALRVEAVEARGDRIAFRTREAGLAEVFCALDYDSTE